MGKYGRLVTGSRAPSSVLECSSRIRVLTIAVNALAAESGTLASLALGASSQARGRVRNRLGESAVTRCTVRHMCA